MSLRSFRRTLEASSAPRRSAHLAVASHGVFAEAANTVLAASEVERIIVTDTIPPLRVTAPGLQSRLVQVSTAGLFAGAIRRLHSDGSIVELLGD